MSDILPSDVRLLLTQIGTHLERIDGRLAHIEQEVAYVKGMIANIPTVYQTFIICFSVLIGLPTVAAIGVWLLHISGKL